MPVRPPLEETFVAMRDVMRRQQKHLTVLVDKAGDFSLASPTMKDRTGRPLFAGGVQIKKNYVSYHMLPLYMDPSLKDGLSPALRKRMQGKACFNFTTVEPALVKELEKLTKRAFAGFKNLSLPWDK
jgi:hypothetical protein